ncbi:phospholipase D family protein [Vibrio ruber]|uniref:phospholipase D family protein n=1 Tax=Vibrio ruber TaxID=184755 RepID=UPI0028929AAF|nr:phospholipase D family protein [Vibrio ruber]WNJ97334.1 phospholipase D family protein [Vibrio ruber]
MVLTNGFDKNELFAKKLNELGKLCNEACFVTAFFTQEQLIKIISSENKPIKLTVSLRPPTNPRALRAVMLLTNVEVRFLGRELHSKLYGFAQGDKDSFLGASYHVAIGSSNMTNGGLYNNIETNVILEGSQAEEAYSQAIKIFEYASPLTSSVLESYEEELATYEPPIFHDITPSPVIVDKGYERIRNAIKYIEDLCSDTIAQNYSNVPVSFVVDHFWHFIVEEKRNEREALKLQTQNGPNDQLTKYLFNEFIQWDQSGEQYCHKMLSRADNLRNLLKTTRTLTASELKEIFLTFHASRYVDERYTGKADEFIQRNSSQKITNSLRYLADESIPITDRIAALQNEPLHLLGFGESAIKEFNGWFYPDKYPIWNKKSDRALNILGFG